MNENSTEVTTTIEAIWLASDLCQSVGRDLASGESILKSDRSPVTVADFGSQAILCKAIRDFSSG